MKKYKIRIAGYKGSKTLFGRLIRFKQKYLMGFSNKYNIYSHVELNIPYDVRLEKKVSRIQNIQDRGQGTTFFSNSYKMDLFKERGLWFSSSETDGGVRFKFIKDKGEHWDFIDLEVTSAELTKILNFMKKNNGNGYGMFQIVSSQLLNLNVKKEGTFFCSEIVTQLIQLLHISDDLCLKDSKFITPADLMKIMDTKDHFII